MEQADTEWKFARTKLWMSYFEDGATVPPPFNVIPTPKSMYYLIRWILKKFCSQTRFAKNEALKTIRRKARQASERDYRYQNVMRLLVRRYITNEQRTAERQRGVTEDDCNEIKQDISALRYELIELLGRDKTMTGTNATVGRKGRQRERRLMKGFDLNFLFMEPTASFDDDVYDFEDLDCNQQMVKSKSSRSRFVRLARGLAGKRSRGNNRWKQLIEATRSKVMPFSRSSESVNSEPCGDNTKSNTVPSTMYRSPRPGNLPSAQSFDANVRRNMFAKKITSFLKEESLTAENDEEAEVTKPTKSEEVNQPRTEPTSQVISVTHNNNRKEWI